MFNELLKKSFLGNSVLEWIIHLSIFLGLLLIIFVFKVVALRYLKSKASQTTTQFDDFLVKLADRKIVPLLILGAFYLSIQGFYLPPSLAKGLKIVGTILATVLFVQFFLSIIIYSLKSYQLKKEQDSSKLAAFNGIITVIRFVVWAISAIVLLDNLGIKISALVAGLGIGGVAIALAAQAVLGDLFSYFTIFFDRPFEIGDFIVIGDFMGTVESFGIKTTRIRSLGGELLIFSNTDLTNSRVRNYKKMEKRRVVFKIGVTYNTPLEKLKQIPIIITNIITNLNKTQLDRVHFAAFGEFNLIFETVYYVLDSSYTSYMDIQQTINFKIIEEFNKLDIKFAFPTQTIYLAKTNSSDNCEERCEVASVRSVL